MQNADARATAPNFQLNKSFVIAGILVILVLAGLFAYKAFRSAPVQAPSQAPAPVPVSESMLAGEYGLKVNLIAVTAAGGMVDLRLKITDSQKAKALLSDQANFPTLLTSDGVVLRTSEDIASQPIKFEDGGNIYVLFMNTQNAVKPGDPVHIVFGNLQVEAIQSR